MESPASIQTTAASVDAQAATTLQAALQQSFQAPFQSPLQDTATLRRHAHELFLAGVQAASPRALVHNALSLRGRNLVVKPVQSASGDCLEFDLALYKRVMVIGCGKAVVPMAQAVAEILGDVVNEGLITTKHGFAAVQEQNAQCPMFTICEAGHPIPDEASVEAARRTLALVEAAAEQDLIINLVTGGGSAVWTLPAEGVTLASMQELTRLLLSSGATIHEMNCLRKHLTQVHGGQLAGRTKATILSLVLSDVVGDALDVIASAPTVADASTFQDAWNVLERRAILASTPEVIVRHLQRGLAGEIPETPKQPPPNAVNVLIGSNIVALRCVQQQAEALGYEAVIETACLQGEAREAAWSLVRTMAHRYLHSTHHRPLCLIAGGETTVTLHSTDTEAFGGRNQEMALAAALALQGMENVVFLSGGTDGNDGPTDAAGGMVDGETIERAAALGLDAHAMLESHNSYTFLKASNDLLFTGATQTNVMDIHLCLRSDV
jgi:hydroxypyruvate reductase